MLFSADSTRRHFTALAKGTRDVKVSYDSTITTPISLRNGSIVLPPPTIHNQEEWTGQAHSEASYLFEDTRFLLGALDSLAADDGDSPEQTQAKDLRRSVGLVLSQNIAEGRSYGEFNGRDQALDKHSAKRITKASEALNGIAPESLAPESRLIADVLGWDSEDRKAWQGYEMQMVPTLPTTPDSLKSLLTRETLDEIKTKEGLLNLIEQAVALMEQPEDEGSGDGSGSDTTADSGADGSPGEDSTGDSEDSDEDSDDSQDDSPEPEGGAADSGDDASSDSPDSGSDEAGDSDSSGDAESPGDSGAGGSDGSGEGSDGGSGDPETPGEELAPDSVSEANGTPDDKFGGSKAARNADVMNHIGSGQAMEADDSRAKEIQLNLEELLEDFKDTSATETQDLVDQRKEETGRDPEEPPRPWLGKESEGYVPLPVHITITQKELLAGGYDNYRYRKSAKHADRSVISKQIRKYLQALSTDSWAYGKTRGRLANRSISRCYSGQRAPRVFRQKEVAKVRLDTAITLLLDCSGSMSGSRYDIGSGCCICMHETLQGLGIPHEILGFTDDTRLVLLEFKPFAASTNRDKLGKALASHKVDMNFNADGESIMQAAERLMTRPEKNKVLIVLSDGSPAGHYLGDGEDYLKEVVGVIEKDSPISIHGIGIESRDVQKFYSSWKVVDYPEDLDAALMGVLKNSVIR